MANAYTPIRILWVLLVDTVQDNGRVSMQLTYPRYKFASNHWNKRGSSTLYTQSTRLNRTQDEGVPMQ